MINPHRHRSQQVKELLEAEGATSSPSVWPSAPAACSGFSYEMFFDGDITAEDEQATFGPTESPVRVVVDPASSQLLAGATLDYKDGPEPGRVRHHEPERQPAPAAAASPSS